MALMEYGGGFVFKLSLWLGANYEQKSEIGFSECEASRRRPTKTWQQTIPK